jgi:predicted nuclease with RNAse H fold
MSNVCYIGWDVGAWNCDKNSRSKDAIVILDNKANLVGTWRGNLRETINTSNDGNKFTSTLFLLCGLKKTDTTIVTMAIDAPLGFSEGFRNLLNGKISSDIESHRTNPYLFRETERILYKQGLKPLSSLKDMIGSQTTKAIHVIAKFAAKIESCGVWIDDERNLKIIETYPSAFKDLLLKNTLNLSEKQDVKDALICAEIAFIFENDRNKLVAPLVGINEKEGWIWTVNK